MRPLKYILQKQVVDRYRKTKPVHKWVTVASSDSFEELTRIPTQGSVTQIVRNPEWNWALNHLYGAEYSKLRNFVQF
jgi:hypothetical protein